MTVSLLFGDFSWRSHPQERGQNTQKCHTVLRGEKKTTASPKLSINCHPNWFEPHVAEDGAESVTNLAFTPRSQGGNKSAKNNNPVHPFTSGQRSLLWFFCHGPERWQLRKVSGGGAAIAWEKRQPLVSHPWRPNSQTPNKSNNELGHTRGKETQRGAGSGMPRGTIKSGANYYWAFFLLLF